MRMQEKLKCGKEGKILAIHVSDKAIVYWLYTEIILICEKKRIVNKRRDLSQKVAHWWPLIHEKILIFIREMSIKDTTTIR